MFRPLALLLVLAATGAVAADNQDDHLSELGDVRVLHAWTTPPENGEVRIYLDIENNGDVGIRLIGAQVQGAGKAVVAGLDFRTEGMPSVEIGAFPVPAGSALQLAPMGPFLLIKGLDPVVGTSFDIDLEFDPLGQLEVHVDVEAEGTKEHPHAGHNH